MTDQPTGPLYTLIAEIEADLRAGAPTRLPYLIDVFLDPDTVAVAQPPVTARKVLFLPVARAAQVIALAASAGLELYPATADDLTPADPGIPPLTNLTGI